MNRAIACEGAPRDLGADQGRAFRDALRKHRARVPVGTRLRDRLGIADPESARFLRDLRRHFPHQSEWLEGLSRSAHLPRPAAARALVAELRAHAVPLLAVETANGHWLARAVQAETPVLATRPEGRFRTLELTPPSLTAPLLGLNEAGLAVAATDGVAPAASCAVPGALFARDCLERFERVEPALEWCLGRPAARGGALLLADARGEVAGVDLSGATRRVLRPTGGVLVLGAEPAQAETIAKRAAEVRGAEALVAGLAEALAPRPFEALACADALSRRLHVPGPAWLELEAELG